MYLIDEKIDAYASEYSQPIDVLLEELAEETRNTTDMPIMLSSNTSANFLRILVLMLKPRLVVELGMFTGFATLNMASVLPDHGRIITCEINPEYAAIARKYVARVPYRDKIEIRELPGMDLFQSISEPVDLVFMDADKESYLKYYDAAMDRLKPGGIIAVDNCLWFGEVLNPNDEEARTIHALNQKIHQDSRVDHVILTVRDGIHLVRKK